MAKTLLEAFEAIHDLRAELLFETPLDADGVSEQYFLMALASLELAKYQMKLAILNHAPYQPIEPWSPPPACHGCSKLVPNITHLDQYGMCDACADKDQP